jgi:hypothetical protein
MKFKQFIITAGAAVVLNAAPVYAQTGAATISQFLGLGEQGMGALTSMAAQKQALEMQRENLESQRQQRAQQQAAQVQQVCPIGERVSAVRINTDGSRTVFCAPK